YYGLPWPCWGTPEFKHPGTHTLYNTNLHVKDGGGTFRARFGVEREVKLPDGTSRKDNHLAEGSYSLGSELKDGYPEFTYGVLKKLGWDKDLTPAEKAVIERIGGNNPDAVSWAIDLSGGIQRVALAHGCIHYGNGKARANAWNLPDPIPVHREPIYTPRPELVTERVGKGVTWCPFHFAGWFQSVDQRGKYPQGCDPIVLGESVNTITTYGFDPVTGMQEPKATLCQVRAA